MASADNALDMSSLQEIINAQLAKTAYLQEQPLCVQKRIHLLGKLQDQYDALLSELDKEKTAIEQKYHAQFSELYKRRADIVSGDAEPSADLLEGYPEKKEGETPSAPAEDKGIPDFWWHAIENCNHLNAILGTNEEDREVLHSLCDISLEYLAESDMELPDENGELTKLKVEGFKLVFTFGPNEYFKQPVLTKTFIMTRDNSELALVKVVGTPITWNAGKNPTKKTVRKTVATGRGRGRGGRGGRISRKTVTMEEDVPSFFRFFSDLNDEDEESAIESDYIAGLLIKEKLIPHAVEYYTGKLKADELDEDEDEDDFDEDDFDDADELDEDDEDDGDALENASAETKPTVTENPECKQQ